MKKGFNLSACERAELKTMLKTGTHRAVELMRARVLLSLDEGQKKVAIAKQEGVVKSTVFNIRNRYSQGGLSAALYDAHRPGKPSHISAEQRAKITALACSEPPGGHGAWTLRLLADRAVALDFVEEISHEAVRLILKKTNSNPI